MLFDIRGRRKRVIQVVYAVLALLMGASLFLVVGPVNLGELVGGSGETRESTEIFEEQAERIEARLKTDPENPQMLISLTRAQVNAGGSTAEQDPTTGETVLAPEGRREYERANETWQRYLKVAGDEVNPSLAQLMSTTSFTLAQNSTSYPEAFEHLSNATEAQQFAAEARPSVAAFATVAAYAYLAGEDEIAAQAGAAAKKEAKTAKERKQVDKQLASFRKEGEKIQKRAKAAAKAEQGQGKEALDNPLGGLGGGGVTGVTP